MLAAPADTQGDAVDIDVVKELQQTLQNRFKPMLAAFLEETPRWLSQLRTAGHQRFRWSAGVCPWSQIQLRQSGCDGACRTRPSD